ncbi:hypothetical protein HLI03_28255 [Rhizobium laguerreae]|uniref:hypothetical protein n=1 Tax=Rhizobium laguerreae TaxID=1076926 RepID=UPI00147832F1|nr:hypothetical protein [Rhizobium laguerreae]NNH45495.1 hypothetical protein [Rhizobium laguerreae]
MRSMLGAATRALLALSALSGCSFFDSNLETACETVLKERLRSPSGYQRVEIRQLSDKVMTREEYKDYLNKTEKDANARALYMRLFNELKPTIFALIITYDAPNAYGTLIRGMAACDYFDRNGDASTAAYYSVEVDGKSSSDWSLDRVKELIK